MRLITRAGIALAVLLLASCSGAGMPEQPTTTEGVTMSNELVPGYKGGCKESFTLYSQNQFNPLGTKIRRSLGEEVVNAGLRGNEELEAVGWIDTGEIIYPQNPPKLQGKVWFYIQVLKAWVPDAGVRATPTTPAPGDEDKYFDPATQAAPQPPECELLPR